MAALIVEGCGGKRRPGMTDNYLIGVCVLFMLLGYLIFGLPGAVVMAVVELVYIKEVK